ncbi:MAG: radical SAM protein [Chloroflexi bacterium]|nr:radical SAM protein [Chloroflexota bacterium]
MNLKSLFNPHPIIQPPSAGLFHYREQTDGGEARMHLRVEPDGSGFLMVNASRVYHFNPTAAFMTYLVLEKSSRAQAVRSIMHAYNVSKTQARRDFSDLAGQIRLIITPAYERVSTLIHDFNNLTADDITALQAASGLINHLEYSHLMQTLQPGDEDNLIALIPVIAGLPAQTRINLIHHLQSGGQAHLSELAQKVEELDSSSLDALQEITRQKPDLDSIEPIFDTILPFSKTDLTAPYRMDLALTYRCNNDCHHCYNPLHRQRNELDTAGWKAVIDELWKAGIPHIIFTGGEPTLRSDLPELIAHAEHNGQITGINTNGRRLQDPQYVQQLVDAGLDHIQITLESHDAQIHDAMVNHPGAWQETTAGIRNALATRLYVMTNTTLLTNNYSLLRETLQFLADLGVKRVGLNALIYSGQGETVGTGLREENLPDLLVCARQMVTRNHQKLTWYTPTQYCHFDPVLFDFETLGVKGCTAALYNMCVEPDGKVLPCQSYYQPIGQILKQPWTEIWNHELAQSLRNRTHVDNECRDCRMLAICGGGCPLASQAGRIEAPHAIHFIDA